MASLAILESSLYLVSGKVWVCGPTIKASTGASTCYKVVRTSLTAGSKFNTREEKKNVFRGVIWYPVCRSWMVLIATGAYVEPMAELWHPTTGSFVSGSGLLGKVLFGACGGDLARRWLARGAADLLLTHPAVSKSGLAATFGPAQCPVA